MEQTLLLNWVYSYPAGHAVEALKVAKGYHSANPGLKVSVDRFFFFEGVPLF